LLNNFANFVDNYKTKHKIFIFSIIKYFKTIIIIFEIIVLTFLINIIVFVLLSKKRDQLSKITKNAFIFKKRKNLSKIRIITSSKQNNDVKIFS